MQAVILARISSKEQQDGHSLSAQVRNLEQYAERKKLHVIKTFTLVESSTKKQRPEFDEMISFIKKQRTKIALIVDTVDRLQRSFKETPIFNNLMEQDILELHFVKEGNVLSKTASSTQKLMWNMGVVMAQSYTDQLSDNVKRSLDYKVRNGEWLAQAPLGYLNTVDPHTGKTTIILDQSNADLIRKFFIEYATGAYSMAELVQKAREWGLTSRKGCILRPQYMHTVIQNSFYYGVMRVKGKSYAHKYEPLISKDTFDRCQRVREGRSKYQAVKKTKYPYLFRGFFRCAITGKQITCDLKKGRYIYLISTNPADTSKKLYVRQEKIVAHIERKLRAITITDEQFVILKQHVEQSSHSEKVHDQDTALALLKEREDIEQQIDKLTDLLISNKINQFSYDRKHAQLQQRHSEITISICENQTHDTQTLETAMITMLYLCKNAQKLFKSSKTHLKRLLLKTLFSNFELNGCNASCALVSPLSLMLKKRECTEWQR